MIENEQEIREIIYDRDGKIYVKTVNNPDGTGMTILEPRLINDSMVKLVWKSGVKLILKNVIKLKEQVPTILGFKNLTTINTEALEGFNAVNYVN